MYPDRPAVSVLIVSSSEKISEFLAEVLPREQFHPLFTAGSAGEARRVLLEKSVDILIVNTPLSDESGIQFAVDASGDNALGIMVIVKSELYDQVSYKVEEYGILTAAKPSNRQTIYQSVKLLVATRARLKFYRDKTMTLEQKMREIRLVSRAKLLLMEQLKMTEPEAHRYLEKAAMDNCVKKTEIAERIIRTYES